MLRLVLSETDANLRGQIKAVLATFIDWQEAYSRQSHILGVKSFIANGVMHSLIPLLISYFQSREMKIKWHSNFSKSQHMLCSGVMGSNVGNWEFDSQTNRNADCVPEDDRFKFVDDLTCLEVVNLINIGIASHNFRQQVPNDIPVHGQIIPASHLMSQAYVQHINQWTKNQEMIIFKNKTKSMITNFTKKISVSNQIFVR